MDVLFNARFVDVYSASVSLCRRWPGLSACIASDRLLILFDRCFVVLTRQLYFIFGNEARGFSFWILEQQVRLVVSVTKNNE
jgi:hypothetical protein